MINVGWLKRRNATWIFCGYDVLYVLLYVYVLLYKIILEREDVCVSPALPMWVAYTWYDDEDVHVCGIDMCK